MKIRLNLFISKSGYCSRRKADTLIKEGRVKVDSKLEKRPWSPTDENNVVEVGNQRLNPKKHVYIIFNKPRGVITTLKDKFAFKKIIDFIPSRYKGVYPAGRLDKASSGLLILTNDGNLCYQLTHPKFGVEKEYSLIVRGVIKQKDLKKAQLGIWDEGDFLKVEKIVVERTTREESQLKVIVHQGKKRHLRRLFSRLGYPVIELKRLRIGDFHLGNLKEGDFEVLAQAAFKERLKKSLRMVYS